MLLLRSKWHQAISECTEHSQRCWKAQCYWMLLSLLCDPLLWSPLGKAGSWGALPASVSPSLMLAMRWWWLKVAQLRHESYLIRGICQREPSKITKLLMLYGNSSFPAYLARWQEVVHLMLCRKLVSSCCTVNCIYFFFLKQTILIWYKFRNLWSLWFTCYHSVGKNYEGNSQIQQIITRGQQSIPLSLNYHQPEIRVLIGLMRFSNDRRLYTVVGVLWWLRGGHIWIAWGHLLSGYISWR